MSHASKTPAPKRTARPAPRRPGPAAGAALPAPLKQGVETLSGMAMDDVRVHYGSTEPARLQALAFAKGGEIHLAPGQERHLPHEAWHLVQQAQGRVQPTLRMQTGAAVNDDPALEAEADAMGARAATGVAGRAPLSAGPAPSVTGAAVAQRVGIVAVEEQPLFRTNHRAASAKDALNRFVAAKRDRYTTYVQTGQPLDITQTSDDTKVTRGVATDTAWVAMNPIFAVQPLAASASGAAQYRITEKTGAEVQVKGNVMPAGQRRGFKFMPTGINSSYGGSLTLSVSGPPWVVAIPKPTPKPPAPTTPVVATPTTPVVASTTPSTPLPTTPSTAEVQPAVTETATQAVDSVETAEAEQDDEPEVETPQATATVETPVPTSPSVATPTPTARKKRRRRPRRGKNK